MQYVSLGYVALLYKNLRGNLSREIFKWRTMLKGLKRTGYGNYIVIKGSVWVKHSFPSSFIAN